MWQGSSITKAVKHQVDRLGPSLTEADCGLIRFNNTKAVPNSPQKSSLLIVTASFGSAAFADLPTYWFDTDRNELYKNICQLMRNPVLDSVSISRQQLRARDDLAVEDVGPAV